MTDLDEQHDVKGLATGLKRSDGYVYDMKAAGFLMPGGRGSLRQAIQWLADHPEFTRAAAAQVRFARRKTSAGTKREGTGRVAQL